MFNPGLISFPTLKLPIFHREHCWTRTRIWSSVWHIFEQRIGWYINVEGSSRVHTENKSFTSFSSATWYTNVQIIRFEENFYSTTSWDWASFLIWELFKKHWIRDWTHEIPSHTEFVRKSAIFSSKRWIISDLRVLKFLSTVEICSLSRLRTLNLQNNLLVSLPSSLSSLQSLRLLSLSYNRINSLPEGISKRFSI